MSNFDDLHKLLLPRNQMLIATSICKGFANYLKEYKKWKNEKSKINSWRYKMENKKITLDSLADGEVSEMFDRELAAVLENISDNETHMKAPREINLKITITPKSHRESLDFKFKCSSKLAGAKEISTNIFIDEFGNAIESGFQKELVFGTN